MPMLVTQQVNELEHSWRQSIDARLAEVTVGVADAVQAVLQ